jgi:hypothetical protein
MSLLERSKIELDEGWRDLVNRIPAVRFRPDWDVKIIPPFAGAKARFWVSRGNANVSVYLDEGDALGFMGGKAYWEIYPAAEGDTARFYLEDAGEMIEAVRKSINRQARRVSK